MDIGERMNYDDTFIRDLTICVLDTLESKIKWTNRFSSGDIKVNVPIYYSQSGDERFLLDSFSPDIASDSQKIELNTDVIPRGHVTFNSMSVRSDEYANPNVWLRTIVENEEEIKKILVRMRAIPMTINYNLTILLKSEIDVFKCTQALLDTLWMYKFMYFEYMYMNIDAVISVPDSNTIKINRQKNLTSDDSIELSIDFEVQTYYPAINRDNLKQNKTKKTTGMNDMNSYEIQDFEPNEEIQDGENEFVNPNRTKWFSDLIKIRQFNSQK